MRKITLLCLLTTMLVVILFTLGGCSATTAGASYDARFRAPARQVIASQSKPELAERFLSAPRLLSITHGKETIDFFPLWRHGKPGSEWIDPQKFLEQEKQRLHEKSGGMPLEMIESYMPLFETYNILFEGVENKLHFLKLAIDLPVGVGLRFNGVGSIKLHVKTPEGKVIVVPDNGILIPKNIHVTDWSDSRNSPATVTWMSIKDKKSDVPAFMFLIVPTHLKGTVVAITLTDKVSIGSVELATKTP